jgi:SAM-dependent methyltransferase
MAPWLYMPFDAKKNQPSRFSDFLRCESCGLGALHPLPDADEVSVMYAFDTYYTHGTGHMKPRGVSFVEKALVRIAHEFDKDRQFRVDEIAKDLPPGGEIVDLGCGGAIYLTRFAELGFSVIGVDPDKDARATAVVKVLDGTAEDIPDALDGCAFDLVIMTHSLEHCRDPRAALANAFRLTKPDGLCYIEVPNAGCEHFRTFTVCSEMFDAPRHLYHFTPTSLRFATEAVGFVEVSTYYHGYIRNFMARWRDWEAEIAARLSNFDKGLNPRRHTLIQSWLLLLRSFWRGPERKFDSIGLLLRRPV